jgi:hypothetical protein
VLDIGLGIGGYEIRIKDVAFFFYILKSEPEVESN